MKSFTFDFENLHPKARKQMDEIVGFLRKDKSFKSQDMTAVTILANSFSIYYQAVDILQKDGIVIQDVANILQPSLPGMEPEFLRKIRSTKIHPALRIANDAQSQITKLLIEFNLTPRRRKKTDNPMAMPDAVSPIDKFVSKKIETR